MDAPVRTEISEKFGTWLSRLQFHGEGHRDAAIYDTYGVVFVSDPYNSKGSGMGKEAKLSKPPEGDL